MSKSFIRKNWITLYVLALEDGCYYVGQSADPMVRMEAHMQGKGAAWTKAHRPISLLERRPAESKNWKHAEEIENQLTRMMMRKYGWERVRGGYWTHVDEVATRKSLLSHECHAELAVSRPLVPEVEASPVTNDTERPVRANQPWTQAEDELLRKFYAEGHHVQYIASQHARTQLAIASRLVHLKVIAHRRAVRRS